MPAGTRLLRTTPAGAGGDPSPAAGDSRRVFIGTVVDFDEHRGYGKVRAADGRDLFFHCTAIADGSRRIAVGAQVVFTVVPGHRGTWEAHGVQAVAASPD